MNPIDFIIIYLACGAPFGVYFYLQNHSVKESNALWIKTVSAFVFWIPFALFIIRKSQIIKSLINPDFNKISSGEIEIEKSLRSIQKTIEKILLESSSGISLFEFRQTIERYAGLTLLLQSDEATISEREKEIFRVAQRKNIETAALCLQRRNRKRLAFHQTKARQDFLQLIECLFETVSDTIEFENTVSEFVNLLSDLTAQKSVAKLFAANLQTDHQPSVRQSEKVLWKTETPKLLITKPISIRLQATTPTTNSYSED